jgi:hypothetical protein
MANLYDPGFGCFYATTSGKNDPYIFPNVEATRQILSYAWSSGMTKDIGSAKAFTPLMKYQIIYYVKAIQNPNGYFYLPELTKAQIDGAIARRGRDLNWCVGLLQEFGASCPYDLPIENSKVHPDGVSADEYWDGLVAEGLVNESDRPVIWSNKATA